MRMKTSSSARCMVAQGQGPLLESMLRFRDRGCHSPETFLAAVSGADLKSFLKDWCRHGRQNELFPEILEPWFATTVLEAEIERE